jgi:hypothetical protein
VLEVIYEQDFLSCSYGFRPGRSAHEIRGEDHSRHRNKCARGHRTPIASPANEQIATRPH